MIGLLWQDAAELLRPAVTPVAAAAVFLSCVRMNWRGLGVYLRRPQRVMLAVLWVLIATPLIVFAVATPLLPADSPLLTGMVLNAAAPSILAAPAWAMILGIDPVLAMAVAVVGTALAPFTVPAVFGVLGLGALDIPATVLLIRLLLFVAVVLVGAWIVKRVAGEDRIARNGVWVDGATVLFLGAMVVGLMDGVPAVVLAEPEKVLLYVILAFAVNIGLQILGALAVWKRDRPRALVLALLSGNRNMAMILGVLADVVGPDLVVYLVCVQFPIFILPLALRPLFRRWTT